jgi:hypothetical protein
MVQMVQCQTDKYQTKFKPQYHQKKKTKKKRMRRGTFVAFPGMFPSVFFHSFKG